ncbi:MAG: TfoX/Sxy family protein [Rhizobium sp.]|nr:TfoX/Sxy family protein [Rhizobium sp.]
MAGAIRNIGPTSAAWLAEIDIHTLDDLRAIGAVEAYARLRFRFGRRINRNMLFAMAAALADTDWRNLTPEHRSELDRAARARLARFEITEI